MVVEHIPPGIRRVCIAVTAVRPPGCPRRPVDGHLEEERLRRCLDSAFSRACVAAGMGRALLNDQVRLVDQVAVLPAGIDEPRVLTLLVAELAAILREAGRRPAAGSRMRLVMAVHEGLTVLTEDSLGGQAIAKTCRMADSDELHATLTSQPSANLIVLLSERIFDDLSEHDRIALAAGKFRRVEIADPPGGEPNIGWVFIAG
jgi:hypothetical protein